jgi:hypothetical protein
MSAVEGGSVALNPPLWRNELDSPPSGALVLFILPPSSFISLLPSCGPPMADKPVIFISATTDLRSARDLVGKVLFSMGFEPVWQDIAAVDGGELLDVLRRRIAPAAVVVQLVGRRYGAEPLRKQSLRLHRNLVLLGIAALVGVVTVGILIFIKFNGDSRPRFISAFCQAGEPFKVRS